MKDKKLSRNKLIDELMISGREESRLSVMFRQAIAQTEGINAVDMECLDFLWEKDSATAGELAKMTGLTTGAITSLIDRLEKAGFVKRERDVNDRRKIIVKLIAERIKEVQKLYFEFVTDVNKVLPKYTDKEIEAIVDWKRNIASIYEKQIKRINESSSVVSENARKD